MKDIRILFEDEDLIAVSKPIGLVVDAGDERTTNGVEDLISVVSATGRKVFPYHRLDKETSGIVLLGKTRRIARDVTKLFEEKRIRKSYLAVVEGAWPKALNKVDMDLHGKGAVTTFRILALSDAASWLEALPKTGRKHQIRIHCAKSGHPIRGDSLYGKEKIGFNEGVSGGHALHAYKLQFKHPRLKGDVEVLDPPLAWKETWLNGIDFASAWNRVFKSDHEPASGEERQ